MANVQTIVSRKGAAVLTVGPEASALDASKLMNEHKIGALVVLENDRVKGMFTERDVLRRIVADQRDPAVTPVGDVMTVDVVTCSPDIEIDCARNIFMEKRIRHLPVLDAQEKLIGLISIGDLNAWELNGQEMKIAALEEYLYGTI
ncbi:CBS domain-containing protein [Algisphaera agarilytica]|uniref:CBS domain-containing protein n=1 Tax=Algisphaera agarilytica TaxID=1385975 RepID=A0A7X0H5I0_9BACT|nr:CBS domain-containing protein [Algisphaera agarilytica]MBB6429656.1 CBS domain-containing protein [Algisphaera agarilytica]